MNKRVDPGRKARELTREARIALIVSLFNERITKRLLSGATDCLAKHGVNNYKVFFCPGSFELPQVAKRLADQKRWDALVCLGAVIRGATPHFEYVSAEVSKGAASVSLDAGLPVIFGVLTTDTIEQAIERAGTKSGNKGWDAALAAVEMANVVKQMT